jgi:hypothetical protein
VNPGVSYSTDAKVVVSPSDKEMPRGDECVKGVRALPIRGRMARRRDVGSDVCGDDEPAHRAEEVIGIKILL